MCLPKMDMEYLWDIVIQNEYFANVFNINDIIIPEKACHIYKDKDFE